MKPHPSAFRSTLGPSRSRNKGVILIFAMIVAAIIAISLGSYISISLNSLKLANRTFYNTAAMNLAETGVEEALWAFNQVAAGTAPATAWASPWDISDGVCAKGTFSYTLSGNTLCSVKVYVDQYNPSSPGVQPIIVAQATVTFIAGGPPLTKTIQVKLVRPSVFSMGLVAQTLIALGGGTVSVDSYDSTLGAYNAALAGGGNNRFDHGSVGVSSSAAAALTLGTGDIWGTASIGGSSIATEITYTTGATGGTVGSFAEAQGTIDTTHVTTNFTRTYPMVSNPSDAGTNLGAIVGPITLGVVGATTPTTYTITSIKLGGTDVITVQGPVILIIPGKVEFKDTSGMHILANSSSIIYAGDALKMGGDPGYGGVTNDNVSPASLQIYGTTANAKVGIKGTSSLAAVIYSPNADVKVGGDGDIYGSFVGNTFAFGGNASFHYDQSLVNVGPTTGSYTACRWCELTSAADRAVYTANLNF